MCPFPGRASIYILRTAFGLDWSERIRIIYAGDDVTDEDAMLALKGMAATFRIASSHITKTSAERRLSSTDSVLAMLKWVERHFSRRKPRANSLTYKSARKARDTIQMHMSYHLPAKTSPRHTPPLTPDKTSSGSDSS
uniref:Trehalose 6-phosphate phosphatase n=1 Tax=Heliothis virescens TaxID=7102 RepID=A0A2A4IU33_HELVI